MKLYLRTFGCRANHYDTEAVRAIATAGGYEIVGDPLLADVVVVNSCAVTSEAERDARKAVRKVARSNPSARTVVMGCASALQQGAQSLRGLPTVEHVIPGADMQAVAAALGVPLSSEGTVRQHAVRALLRVQDGCDEHCTFCATTMARGANRSRGIDALAAEADRLAEHHPEIVLTGTHIGTYGADTGSSLGQLVEQLVRRVPTVRFRLSSVEATEVDALLAELLTADSSRVAPHLHAPLQSGSDRVLRRMGRHWYTRDSYALSVERLTESSQVFGLGGDVVVGFPGESEADFMETVAVVERLRFTYLHVFTYSPRPGTAATRLPGTVDHAVARDRSERLRALAHDKAYSYARWRDGSRADAIVVGSAADRRAVTEDYLTVGIQSPNIGRGQRFGATLRMEGQSLVAV